MPELENQIWNVVQTALLKGAQTRLERGYDNPLDKIIDSVVAIHSDEIKTLMDDLFTAAIRSESFVKAASEQLAHKVAKCLMNKMEGSIEKCANTLRSDPTTKAKILLAIETIVKDHQPKL